MRKILSVTFIWCLTGCLSGNETEQDALDTQSPDPAVVADGSDTEASALLAPVVNVAGAWETFPTLCQASWCVNNGNLVAMWQSILWADGMFISTSSIDGDFGSKSNSATVTWQNNFLPSDGGSGNVGPNTWRAATERLDVDGVDACQGGVYRFIYRGWTGKNFRLTENCATFQWKFVNPRTGAPTDTSYNY